MLLIDPIFSPVPINFIGAPVIDFIESAAPPLPSPSTRVRMIVEILIASLNFFAIFAAS